MANRNRFAYDDTSNAAVAAVAVTPHDTTVIPTGVTRALYIGVSGDVNVLMADGGTAVTFKSVPIGILPVRVQRVNSTSTTATNILALY
jgi:hypothetical protein